MSDLDKQFLRIVSPEQMHAIYKAIKQGCYDTFLEYESWEFDASTRSKSHGHLRNSFIEANLLKAELPEGVKVERVYHQINGYAQLVITIQERIVLTLKSNDDPYTLPDVSDLRKENAQKNKRLPLIDLLKASEPSYVDKREINGIVTFQRGYVEAPEFMSVVFPSPSFLEVMCDRVDLLSICTAYEADQRENAEKRVLNQRRPITPEKKTVTLKKKA